MLNKIKDYIEKQDMLKKEDCVIVGVSGGADSICLLFVLLELQKSMGFQLVAVHVNHGLRGEDAMSDECFVKEICEKHNIPFVRYFENVELLAKKWKQSTEEAGRNFRRACFEQTMKEMGGTKIALAHHKNDSVETMLMNLARGTGLKGLGGIAPVQGCFIRPLLCVERREIAEFLQVNGISYRVDQTNMSDEYTRNRIRNHVIPYMEENVNGKIVSHVDDTMTHLREVYQYMEEQVSIWKKTCVCESESGILIKEKEFLRIPDVLKSMLLKEVLGQMAEAEKDLESVHVKTLIELFQKQVGRKVDLPYQIEAKRCYEGISFSKKKEDFSSNNAEVIFRPEVMEYMFGNYRISCRIIEQKEMKNYTEKSGVKWFDYDIIKNGISFRTRRPGDYITIHEDGRTQKIKAYFINEKIPQGKRDEVLLVAEGSHVLWICGYRDNCAYRVSEHTKHILEIKVDKGE